MGYFENIKQYTDVQLDQIFFRPMLCGPSAVDLGVRVLYNMPMPTTVYLWEGHKDILQTYDSPGWSGGPVASKYQKTIPMHRVKAELGFSAADYFSLVYEKIATRPGVNMDDLSGTELEEAETALFREALAESIRTTMWIGNTAANRYNTFNGFLKPIRELMDEDYFIASNYTSSSLTNPEKSIELLERAWGNAPYELRDQKESGQLAYFVTTDFYECYERYLDSIGAEASYMGTVDGRPALSYHGVPLVDVHLSGYLPGSGFHPSFCLLTDRRNLVVAVNTADFPGNEVRMWYNPDEMENRQRAVFMIGCEILDETQLSYLYSN